MSLESHQRFFFYSFTWRVWSQAGGVILGMSRFHRSLELYHTIPHHHHFLFSFYIFSIVGVPGLNFSLGSAFLESGHFCLSLPTFPFNCIDSYDTSAFRFPFFFLCNVSR